MDNERKFEELERLGKQALVLASTLEQLTMRINKTAAELTGVCNIDAFGKDKSRLFQYGINCTRKASTAFCRINNFAVSKFDKNVTTKMKCSDDLRQEAYDILRLTLLWQNATTLKPIKRVEEIEDYLNKMCEPEDRLFSKKFIDSLKLKA